VITGRNVVLRRVEPADYADIQRWQNDPEVFRWMDYHKPFSLDDVRRSEEKATKEGIPFVIEVDGHAIGRIGLNNFRRRDNMASLYIFIGERGIWGRGHGFDAMMTLLRYGFDVLGLRLIELWQLEGNERAFQMYKHCGFTEDALIPNRSFHDGRYLGHVVLSIDRETFERTRAANGY
jgi:RimJ/RimL family protein N-acetyltransferase